MEKSITTSDNLSPWPIKGISRETRTALKKAAKIKGLTLGELFNTELRTWANQIIQGRQQASEPPAKIDHIERQIEGLIKENEKIEKMLFSMRQQINERPSSLWEHLFKKRNKQ